MISQNLRRGALFLLPFGVAIVGCGDETVQIPGPLVAIQNATMSECPDGGRTIVTGVDQNRNDVLDESEIDTRRPICAGAQGEPGEAGIPGTNALVRTTEEAAGDNCDDGGVRIEVGLDGNGNDTLDQDEIDQTSFVCDGPDGIPGLATVIDIQVLTGDPCPGLRLQFGLDLNENGSLDADEINDELTQVVCNGDEGLRSLVNVVEEPAGANCPVGGQRIESGIDVNDDGVLDEVEIQDTEYVCDAIITRVRVSAELAGTSTACADGGSRIETGPDTDGNGRLDDPEVTNTSFVCNGAAGQQTLVAVTAEPAGANCTAGGQRVETGVDLNEDGTLQASEISSTSYVCNGEDGQDGSGGNAVRVSSEAAGANCPNGGTRIETGPDSNGNGTLDPGEVTNTTFACQGAASTTLVTTTSEPAGANCTNGGLRIDTGVDDNDDGVLGASEIDSTQFVCDTVTGTQVPFGITTLELPSGFTNDAYEETLEALGGTGGNYSWSVVSGAIPTGLTLDPSGTPSTTISGTLQQPGVFNFVIQVEDFFGQITQRPFSISVTPPPCQPGVDGMVGEAETTISTPSTISTTSYQIAADTSTSGYVYIIGTSSLDRFSKDGLLDDDVLALAGLTTTDAGYEIEIDGDDIYAVSDATTGTSNRVQRISDDGGVTFTVQDMMDFSVVGAPDDIRGIEVVGTTLYAISHGIDCVIYEADISGTLPASASEVVTLTGWDNCTALAADDDYFYTAYGDTPLADTEDGILRIDRVTFATQRVYEGFAEFNLDDFGYNAVEVQDTDGDGLTDVLYASGDSGAKRYICDPTGSEPFFSRPYAETTSGDNGLSFDPVNDVIWAYDESGNDLLQIE